MRKCSLTRAGACPEGQGEGFKKKKKSQELLSRELSLNTFWTRRTRTCDIQEHVLENSQSLMTNEYTGSLPSPSTEKFSAVWVPSKSFTQMGAKLDPKVCITRWIFETHPLPPYNLSILGSLTLLLINTTAIRHLSSF